MNFKNELSLLLKNKNYLLLVICFTTLYGTSTTIGAIISSLTKDHYKSSDNSIFGAAFILFGLTGSVLSGVLLDKYHMFKLTVIFIGLANVVTLLCLFVSLPSDSPFFFALNIAFVGFAAVPMAPVSLNFAVELTYPSPEAMSNGMMILPAKIYAAFLSLLCGYLASIDTKLSISVFVLNALICSVAAFFIEEDLRRLHPCESVLSSHQEGPILESENI